MVALETPLAKNQLSEVLSVYHEHLNHLKLDNLDLNDKLAPLFEIPYPVLDYITYVYITEHFLILMHIIIMYLIVTTNVIY